MLIGNYNDQADSPDFKITHAVNIKDVNYDICTVTGHIDFNGHGFSMYAENTNPARCSKSNGMSSNGYELDVTVK